MATRSSINPAVRESTPRAPRASAQALTGRGLTDPRARAPVRARLPDDRSPQRRPPAAGARLRRPLRSITTASTSTAPPAPSQAASPAVMSAPSGSRPTNAAALTTIVRDRISSEAIACTTTVDSPTNKAPQSPPTTARPSDAGSAVKTPTGTMLGRLDVIGVDARIRLAKEACRALPPGRPQQASLAPRCRRPMGREPALGGRPLGSCVAIAGCGMRRRRRRAGPRWPRSGGRRPAPGRSSDRRRDARRRSRSRGWPVRR
jgi:hypothetical protein